MISQNILYSECPCGSGKKFKFCCYPSVRNVLPDDPSRADVLAAIRNFNSPRQILKKLEESKKLDLAHYYEFIHEGLDYLSQAQFDKAESAFIKAKNEFDILPPAYNNLIICALMQGDLKTAEKRATETIERFPIENPFAIAQMANIHYLKGDIMGAWDFIEKAKEIEPPSADHVASVCESMAHFKQHEQIIEYTDKSGFNDAPEVAFFRGIAFANLGNNIKAEHYLRMTLQNSIAFYTQKVLDDIIAGKRPSTICGDWMYFIPQNFNLFASLSQDIINGEKNKLNLLDEVLSEYIEIYANAGLLNITEAIKLLSKTSGKRSEQLLNALRSNPTLSPKDSQAADKAYKELYGKNGLGKQLQSSPNTVIQQMIISEEAKTSEPIALEYEDDYNKAVTIIQNPNCTIKELFEALEIMERLHKNIPDNPAVSNNYASTLSRLGRTPEAIDLIEECYAEHPEYVFGAANYLGILLSTSRIEEAKAMVKNYRLPQRIHPQAYICWCRVLIEYSKVIGDKFLLKNTKDTMNMIIEKFK